MDRGSADQSYDSKPLVKQIPTDRILRLLNLADKFDVTTGNIERVIKQIERCFLNHELFLLDVIGDQLSLNEDKPQVKLTRALASDGALKFTLLQDGGRRILVERYPLNCSVKIASLAERPHRHRGLYISTGALDEDCLVRRYQQVYWRVDKLF